MHKNLHKLIIPIPFVFFITCLILLLVLDSNQTPAPEVTNNQLDLVSELAPDPEPVELPIELPFGGTSTDEHVFVALYGSPDFKGLGSLGEQPIQESINRAKDLTQQYQAFSDKKIIPTFEIITTIASVGLTANNDYSQETDITKIRPWIDAAKENQMYVLLDLQPGRATFLQQAIIYEELLKEPHVGLALDPEWRLQTENDRHLKKVGSVSATEINETSEWLANLVKTNKLPQKIFMIHQFKFSMIQNREVMKTDREELSYIIHIDGFGTLGQKTETWNRMKENLPQNVNLGWKNFFDEDKPTPTPEQTMSLNPQPHFISYQ